MAAYDPLVRWQMSNPVSGRRETLGWTQAHLASVTRDSRWIWVLPKGRREGVCERLVQAIELGEVIPSIHTIEMLAGALGVVEAASGPLIWSPVAEWSMASLGFRENGSCAEFRIPLVKRERGAQ